ncbi:MAG: hypothetical protein HOP18_19345 [Deltaproteobacteria bacterium]|nr:hypothetical protein [Deltaproteobacteria bacterium]
MCTLPLTRRALSSQQSPLASVVVLSYKQSMMDSPAALPEPYPQGTIISCPATSCGVRLYRLCEAASFVEVVLQDKKLLVPINAAIPARSVWEALACPLCGTALTDEGRLHTAAYGWR